MVSHQFKLDSFQESHVFTPYNKKKDSTEALRNDKNGFILATKKLHFLAFKEIKHNISMR